MPQERMSLSGCLGLSIDVINLRLYVWRDVRLRIGSGIWIDRKRWGRKNAINIPLIQGEEREKTFFDIIEIYLATRKLSENRIKNFRVLVRCLHRFELYKRAADSRGFSLSFTMLTPELLRQIETFLLDEQVVFLHYPEIY